MGRNKELRKKIAGLDRSIQIHQQKVDEERAKPVSDETDIEHWQSEIETFRKRKERLTRRLLREW